MIQRIRYDVGPRVLEVTGNGSRWTAAVDGVTLDRWYMSSADAWTAGVTEALRLDAGAAYAFVGRADADQRS
jgi:hypothetical protein